MCAWAVVVMEGWWAYQFLFPRTFFNVKVPPKLELLGTFCAEDGMRALPNSTEPIGVADW